jgi:Holliday junction resolvasome RuvABC endonuclease subunit
MVGWAYGGPIDIAPSFGCWRLPKIGGEGARYAAFENELADAMDRFSPSRLVLEAPLSFQALLGVSTAVVMKQQYTLRGIAYAEAWRASVPISEVSSDIVRLAVLGQARFAKDKVKAEVVAHCRGLGLDVPDHNAGDACLVWIWHTSQTRGTATPGRLFSHRETVQ